MAYEVSRFDPCDFFLWGYLKDQIFCELSSTVPELKTKIRQAISSFTAETLEKVYKNIEFRSSFMILQNSGHFEHLLD